MQNLLKIGQVKEHPPDHHEVERLLAAAERNLRDAKAILKWLGKANIGSAHRDRTVPASIQ